MNTEDMITIPMSKLRQWLLCMESGFEHTSGALIEHEASLGRTTLKNRRWAEVLEVDIARFAMEADEIRKLLPIADAPKLCDTPHNED